MKSILYVGATLMIGASIYGFVDYKQTGNKKEFKELYSEKKSFPANNVIEVNKVEPVEPVKEITVADINAAKKMELKKKSSKKISINKVVKKKRRFSTNLFSRGALDEKYTEPIPVKKVSSEARKN